MPRPSGRSIVKLTLLAFLVGGSIAFLKFTETGRSFDADVMLNAIRQFAPYDRLVYVAAYILGTALMVPGTILSFAGAVLFGVWEGTLYTWIGATLGAAAAFATARLLGREFVNDMLAGRLGAFNDRVRDQAFRAILILRLVPVFPFVGVNLASGLVGIRFRDYLLATALGILPGTFVYQYLFAKVGAKALTRGVQWSDFTDPEMLTPIGVFILFLSSAAWFGRRTAANGSPERSSPRQIL